jgi:hypothetical protein
VVDYLNESILEATCVRNLHGIKIEEIVSLTHLLLVDDVLLFTNDLVEKGRKIQEII